MLVEEFLSRSTSRNSKNKK